MNVPPEETEFVMACDTCGYLWEDRGEDVCPNCGSEYIDEVEERVSGK